MNGQALVKSTSSDLEPQPSEGEQEFVTFNIAGQLFGIPVLIVQDILLPENIASVPLAPPEVRGSINLRGRIVTVIDVRIRLGLERRAIDVSKDTPAEIEDDSKTETSIEAEIEAPEDDAVEAPSEDKDGEATEDEVKVDVKSAEEAIARVKHKNRSHMMGVTVEHHNDLYTLLVDSVGDVISLGKDGYEGNPSTLDPTWREVASGVYRLEEELMVVLDVDRLLDFTGGEKE